MSVAVILVAAGSGSRLGSDRPKAFVRLAKRPLLRWALDQAFAVPGLTRCVIVAPRDCLEEATALLTEREREHVVVVPGGRERTQSVRAGLAELGVEQYVLIHDAARCLTPLEVFERVLRSLEGGSQAAVPGVAVTDTIKEVDMQGFVVDTLERAKLRAIQTPQGFTREVIEAAHAQGTCATDDAALVEELGQPVHVVAGHELAFKITVAADLERAERCVRPAAAARGETTPAPSELGTALP